MNLAGVSFLDNTATSQVTNDFFLTQCAGGGAILNRGGTVNASNCSFADNNAQTPTPADQTTLQALVPPENAAEAVVVSALEVNWFFRATRHVA